MASNGLGWTSRFGAYQLNYNEVDDGGTDEEKAVMDLGQFGTYRRAITHTEIPFSVSSGWCSAVPHAIASTPIIHGVNADFTPGIASEYNMGGDYAFINGAADFGAVPGTLPKTMSTTQFAPPSNLLIANRDLDEVHIGVTFDAFIDMGKDFDKPMSGNYGVSFDVLYWATPLSLPVSHPKLSFAKQRTNMQGQRDFELVLPATEDGVSAGEDLASLKATLTGLKKGEAIMPIVAFESDVVSLGGALTDGIDLWYYCRLVSSVIKARARE